MAIGLGSDFKIHQPFLHTRINEMLTQNGDAFNEASNGAIRLGTETMLGDYNYESFFASLGATLAARRDVTSQSTQADVPMTQEENISVKCNRKIKPVAQTRDAFRKIFGRFSVTEFSGLVAEQVATIMSLEMLNTALSATRAALRQQTASYVVEGTPAVPTLITTTSLVNALALMGDNSDKIVAWVMHSKPYFDLVKNQIAANITGISNFNVATASPVTLNRPVIVTDSASLLANLNSPDVNNYMTLGLVRDATQVINSEEQEVVIQDVTGNENLSVRIQGEYAYNLGIKGFKWDTAAGGVNPDDTALALGTNWDSNVSSVKNRAGVCLMSL